MAWVSGKLFSANEDLWSLWKGKSLHAFTRHSILRILYVVSYKALTLMILIFYQIDSMKQNKLILWKLFHISRCDEEIHRKPPGSSNHAIWLGRCFRLKTVRGKLQFPILIRFIFCNAVFVAAKSCHYGFPVGSLWPWHAKWPSYFGWSPTGTWIVVVFSLFVHF